MSAAFKGVSPSAAAETFHPVQDNSSGLSQEKTVDAPAVDDRDADYSMTKNIVIRKAEIMADQYKGNIVLTVILLFAAFIIGYGYGLDANIRYVYTAFASASYNQHSLITTIGVINGVIGAASQIIYARLSDVYGRLPILIVSIVFYVVGTIIQCQAYDIERYCAGSVFYNLGYVGVLLVVLLILSDVSSLKWRLFYQFIPTLPFIINTWISGNVTSAVGTSNWQWGIGMWAFIFPLTSLPFVCCLIHMWYLARKTPEWAEVEQSKTYYQKHGLLSTLVELFHRLDVAGVILMIALLGCILTPLTLAGGYQSKWHSGKIIGPLVLGIVLIPVFIFFESKFAKYPIAPAKLIKDRGIWAAICLSFLLDFIYYMAYDYLYTVLVVAMNQSVASATRITSVSSFTSVVWSPVFAIIVYYIKRMKPFIVTGVSCWFLALGLLYHFRGGEGMKDGVIGALVVWGIGTTMFSYPIAVSMQSVTRHEHMATVTALSYTLYRIGSAVGNSVSGAIWTQLLPARLLKDLGNATLAASVYGDPYTFASTYTWGSPEREAVVSSYRYIQRLETVVGLCFCTLLVTFAFFLRDPELTDAYAHDGEMVDGELIYKGGQDKIYDATFGRIFGRKSKSASATAPTNVDVAEVDSEEEKKA
ncbi:CYFA0S01e09340g1_1 [Cyberlindnera fabianii]|uniref:CYFA0S01e09340g1_1 n=1 Tax=Cyberlindnera fabianii TaxID=36022 RepID=A0A061AJH4_CYBFA|nr:CYFA0S01e09340g1_1 [Cyberlindnera fabianii]